MTEENRGEFYYAFYTPPGRYAETVRFYTDVCGFPRVGPAREHGAYIECGGGRFEIWDGDVDSVGRTFMLRGAAHYESPRGGCLLIEVEDVDALHERLQAGGAEIVVPPTDFPWRYRQLFTPDPSGNLVAFFTRLPGWEQHHSPPAR